MTFSVVGRDAAGRVGAAVASCVLAIGSRALRASGHGLLVVQGGGWSEDLEVGLLAIGAGSSARETVEQLAALGRPDAQYAGVLVAPGPPANWSGPTAPGWADCAALADVAVQGNTLVSEQVLEACRDTWLARPDLRLEERLLDALAAGTAAGGDLRGQQSAALLTIESSGEPRTDLRVDDDPSAVRQLEQLLTVARAHELLQQAWALVPDNLGAAAEILRSSLQLAPDDGLLLQSAALVLVHIGAAEAALECWRGALPGLPDPQARLRNWAALPWTDPSRLRHLDQVERPPAT